MYALVNVSSDVAERVLIAHGSSPTEVLRITALAITDGVYVGKRLVFIHDAASETWTVVVRGG